MLRHTGFPCPVAARHSPRSFNQSRKGAGKDLLDEEEHLEKIRWAGLSTKEKIGDWALKQQYSLILGSWAASLGLAAAIIMKDRHQTTSQKVRQVSCPSLEDSDRLVGWLVGWLGFVGCSSSYVGTRVDHWRPHRCWYPDTPGS